MKKYPVKKLWNGRVSLRDYIVEKHIRNKEPIKVIYNMDEMVL